MSREDSEARFRIIRNFKDPNELSVVIKTGLTLEDAQAHCRDKETCSRTCTSEESHAVTRQYGEWFDGYEDE